MISKRILDIFISGTVLLLMAPAMLIVSVLVAVTMGWPVVFSQKRPGYKGKDISVMKFRTMTNHTDAQGNLLPDWMRETRIGAFLRVTSLDELPQFISVFLGHMSLVGPRPLMHIFVDNCNPIQRRRFEVRPGITGLAQIHGRKSLDYDKRFAYDVWYVDNHSFWLDLKIMLITLRVLFRREGLTETGHMIDGGIAAFMEESGLCEAMLCQGTGVVPGGLVTGDHLQQGRTSDAAWLIEA